MPWNPRFTKARGGRFGAWYHRLTIGENGTAPVYAPLTIKPTSTPSGTAQEGDVHWNDAANAPKFYDGSAWVTVAGTDNANTFSGANLFSAGLNYKQQVTDTGGAYATPIALTEAQTGRVILVDDAAGLDFTLPAVAAAQVGTWYKFLVTVTITSNNLRVTAATGDLLRGGVAIVDFDTANTVSYFTPDESDDLVFTANGSTKGGKKGSVVTFTAIHATGWFVEGLLFGDGSLATPFA